MPLKTARLTISRESLPQQYRDLGIRFERQSVAKIKAGSPPSDMVLLRPAAGLLSDDEAVGSEPRWNHILCGLSLKTGDGTAAQGSGQLLITGRRFIGMIDDGTASGAPPLSIRKSGNVFCFTFLRDDVSAPVIKKNLLKPSDFSFRSNAELGGGFRLTVFAAFAYVANGKTDYWHDKNMLYTLSEEGRQRQLQD